MFFHLCGIILSEILRKTPQLSGQSNADRYGHSAKKGKLVSSTKQSFLLPKKEPIGSESQNNSGH